MTINTQTGISDVMLGDGVNLVFPFDFKIATASEIDVYVDGQLIDETAYTVTLSLDWTGSVTFDTAPVDDAEVVLASAPAFVQSSEHLRQGPFFPDVVEDDLDKAALRDIALKRDVDRAFKIPVVDPVAQAGKFPVVLPDGTAGWSTGTGADAGLRTDLAASGGSGLVGFLQSGTGAVARTAQDKMRDFVSVSDFGAVGDGVTDDTVAINAAISASNNVYAPPGVYLVDPDIGIVLKDGTKLVGAGLMRTIFKAAAKGGTLAELQAYTKGSVIKRAFTPGVANSYVTGCYLADFAVHLNHPAYNAANYRQIGVDLRNITRSTVERVHVGTLGIPGQTVCPVPSASDACQGYGFVLGTKSAGDVDYCGGEVNTLRDCYAWGAFKNIAIDESALSPLSAAHATLIDNCDVQGGHELITQSSQYTAGCIIRDAIIQSNYRQTGNANPTVGLVVSGYNCKAHVKYAEMGTACDTLFGFSSASKNCDGEISYYSYTGASTGTISDAGNKNALKYPDAVSGISSGDLIELYDKAYRRPWVKFHWDGAAIVIDGSSGVQSVTRNGTGDYTVTWAKAFPSANYAISAILDTNASGHGGLVTVGTQSTTNVRFYTYAQNGGVTTQLDPLFVNVRASI